MPTKPSSCTDLGSSLLVRRSFLCARCAQLQSLELASVSQEELAAQVMAEFENARQLARESQRPVVAMATVAFPGGSATDAELPPEDEDLEFDRPWKGRFIEWLRKGKPISLAAELAGVSKRHAYRCRHTDLKFGRAWARTKRLLGSGQGEGGGSTSNTYEHGQQPEARPGEKGRKGPPKEVPKVPM